MAKVAKPNGAVALSKNAGEASGAMVKASKRTRKQPYRRTEKLENAILSRLACGESLIAICQDPKMPARQTVMTWMTLDPEFEAMMDDAYKWKARYFGEAILDVAEGGTLSTGDIRRDELKIKALMWLAGKYNRRLFGDAVEVAHKHEGLQINMPAEWMAGEIIPTCQPQVIDVDIKSSGGTVE
ncbi:hypothetical protein [Sphingobium sp. KCTC 72723]|uniref:terminase small subunit-like protein n=1 Tax=Sphingobium sp. KCTC 72723 TaxID=2733867 RepID=UPI00165E7C67|nr:hypothetical protein [Sphingobium sp. KCTC 72723]